MGHRNDAVDEGVPPNAEQAEDLLLQEMDTAWWKMTAEEIAAVEEILSKRSAPLS